MSEGSYGDFLKYKDRFDAFKKITNEFDGVLSWLKTNKETLHFDSIKRILSIGAGTGSFDKDFFSLFDHLELYTIVEPNTFHMEEFKKNVGNNGIFKYQQSRIEEFTFTEEYDLVLISHSLYYIDDFCTVLQNVNKYTRSCLIFHQTTYGINDLQTQFGDSATNRYRLSSDQIVECLEKIGLSYQTWRIDASIDVADAQDIHIDFFLEKDTTNNERAQVREYLATQFPEGRMYHPVDAIFIQQR